MRVVVQRCSRAEVRIDGERVGHIKKGFVLLVGVTDTDSHEEADILAKRKDIQHRPANGIVHRCCGLLTKR